MAKIDTGDEVVLRLTVVRTDPDLGVTVAFGNGVRVTLKADSDDIVEVVKAKPLGKRNFFDKPD